MKEQLIKTIQLENDLSLTIYDASKPIAGDRWQVTLSARILIPVNEKYSGNNPAYPPIAEIKQALADTVEYETKKQRNFIDDKAKIPRIIKESSDRKIQDEAGRSWNLLTTLYYKGSGRIPWRRLPEENEYRACYIGVSFYRDVRGLEFRVESV